MAKCTDKERALLDAYLKNDEHDSLFKEVMEERIPKELRNRYKLAYSNFLSAQESLKSVRSEFFEIGCGKDMISIMDSIVLETTNDRLSL